jgi:HEAT repeat protein
VLNALMKLDAFTLERVLVTRFEGEFNRPTAAPQQPQAQPQKALPQRSLKYTGPLRTRRRGPLGESPVPGAAAARSGAPLSWIALAHFKNSAAVARFVQLLDGRDPTRRLYAVEALGEVHDPGLVPLLTALLQDKQAAVRQTAAKALVEAPDADIVGALNKAMDKDLLVSAIVERAPAIAAKVGAEATASLLAKMLTAAATRKAFAPAPVSEDGPTPAAAPPEDPNVATPVRIMGALIRLGLYSPEVKTAFEAARESPDPSVRVAAYRACAQEFAGADAAERSASLVAAAGAALKDKESTVRCAGIGLLSAAEPSEALPLLLPALKAPEADVRAAALSALPETDDPRIVAAITSSLADPNPLVVAAAARAAARRHDPALGVAVLAVLNQVGSRQAERPAAGQASQPGRPAFSMRGSPAQPSAAKATGDQTGILVAALADAAADLQPQAAAGALANLLAYPQPEVRVAAVHALGRLKDSTALNSLLSCLQDKDPSVLSAAITALGEFDATEAVQAVLDTLGRSALAPELRRQILTRLANHCADPSSAYGSWAATGTALKDSDLDILVSMAPAATGDERAGLIALATRYLADAHPETRKRAASILGNYADDESVRTKLLNALEQDAAGVAPAAANVLRRIRDNSMIDVPLLAYYKDLAEPSGSGGTPAPAAAPLRPTMPMGRGMANAPLPPPVPAAPAPAGPKYPGLLKASQTENAQLRTAIIEALGGIGGDHAGKALRTIAELEQKRNSDEMTPKLIAAFESVKGATSARDLCDCYVISPGRYRLDAIAVLAHLGPFDSTHVADTLKRLAETAATPPDVAAASVDALDELGSAGGGA